jgi:Leucine-rich repeat (LRR) protein
LQGRGLSLYPVTCVAGPWIELVPCNLCCRAVDCEGLRGLSQLRELHLTYDGEYKDEGALISQQALAPLTSLTSLTVHGFNVDGSIMLSLSCLTSLQRLKLSFVYDIKPMMWISALTALTHLWLDDSLPGRESYCDEAGAYESLSSLTNLQSLHLQQWFAAPLLTLVKLSSLSFTPYSFKEEEVGQLTCLTRLQHLEVPAKDLEVLDLQLLPLLVSLKMLLGVYKRSLSDDALQRLCLLTNLQHLDLTGQEDITSAGIEQLSSLTKLQHLDLTGLMKADGVAALDTLTALTFLSIAGCTLDADIDTDTLLGTMSRLQSLNLGGVPIGYIHLPVPLYTLTALTFLGLRGMAVGSVTSEQQTNLKWLAESLIELRSLDVSHSKHMLCCDWSLFKHVTELHVEKSPIDAAFFASVLRMPSLCHLYLSGTEIEASIKEQFISRSQAQLHW